MSKEEWQPRYRADGQATTLLDGLEQRALLVDKMLLLPRYQGFLRREVALERASSTTKIEGIGDEGDDSPAQVVEQANENARRAYEFVDYMSDLSEEPLSELVVRQINREFLRGAAETLTPGVYRRGQNTVGGYTPPDQGDVPGLMRSFAEWLQHGTDHPLVAAGLAHVHLVAIHPFWDGNGRTARALEALVIQRSPFHFRKLLSMEKQLLDGRARYFAALDHTLGLAFGEYDATPWLEFYLATLSREADRLISTLETWHHGIEGLHEAAGAGELLPRQAEALVLLLRAGELTRADYAEVAGVSAVTASRDLRELMARGWVTAEGATTTRRYLAGAKLGSLLQGGDQR